MQIWKFFIERWRITSLLVALIVLLGWGSLQSLPLESNPEVKIPIATVSTVYSGASPTDVEELITTPLEQELDDLDDVDSITSTSSEGVSVIVVQFEAGADLKDSVRELQDEVKKAQVRLPDDASESIVAEISLDDRPIINVSIVGNATTEEVAYWGEQLQEELESISGVLEVDLAGVDKEEVQIFVDRGKLANLELTLGQVLSTLRSENMNFPVGSVLVDTLSYQVSFKGQLKTPEQISQVPILEREGQTIVLGDIAEVRRSLPLPTSSSSIYIPGEGERNAVSLSVKKQTGANVTEVADTVRERAEIFGEEELPTSFDAIITGDRSVFVREDVAILASSAMQTVLIIAIILFLALGVKEALLVGGSIPLIFLITFIGLSSLGFSLNGLVLFSLILSLGIVVDTSIIMIEGMFEARERGLNARDAALDAVKTYRAPLVSGTLTTMSAFFPMTLMTGITGEYVKFIPLTINVTLIASLFVALFIVPAIGSWVYAKFKDAKKKEPILGKYIQPLRVWYEKHLLAILRNRSLKKRWVWGMVAAFVLSLMLPILGFLKLQLFPPVDIDFFYVNVELPVGTKLEKTEEKMELAKEIIFQRPEIESVVSSSGAGGSHLGRITVNIVDGSERALLSYEISEQLREEFQQISGARVEIEELAAGPPVGAPIEARLFGDSLDLLETTAQDLVTLLKGIPGTQEVESSVSVGTGEFVLAPKREALRYYGISAQNLASELRTLVFGADVMSFLEAGEEIDVRIRGDFRLESCREDTLVQVEEAVGNQVLCESVPRSVKDIEGYLISTQRGLVPVSELASVELAPNITEIQHQDTETVVYVRSSVNAETVPTVVVEEVQDKIASGEFEIPEGVRLDFGGETESTTESFESLGRAMNIGIFLIAFILVLQFQSYRQPFIILGTLPLALIGVFFGLALLGRNFSFPGFIGIVALMGVVVNDAIVLIDRMNQKRKEGELIQSVVEACSERLQPVILTTLTTALGVLPLAFADEVWGDLAWTIFFGMLFATTLTLLMVPILYTSLYNGKKRFRRTRRLLGWVWSRLGHLVRRVLPEKT